MAEGVTATLGKAAAVAGTVLASAFAFNFASGPTQDDARKDLANKVTRTYQNIDVKVAQIPGSTSGSGQQFNRNDGNSFGSISTYHSYTWDYCQQWVGPDTCGKWLDPYVSEHGFGSDQSPLEGAIGRVWEQQKEQNKGQGGKYAIWNVETRPGQTVTDDQGRLNRSALTRWELNDEAREAAEKVGDAAAYQAIASTYDSTDDANTMPNMESLRAMAQSYTYAFRNNLVAKQGEIRRMRDAIQMPGGESYADCMAGVAEAQQVAQTLNTDQKLFNQSQLDIQARSRSLEERTALCQKMMNTSVYAINPQVRGNNIASGDANKEQIDEWRIRLNIAAVDYAGADVGAMARPQDATLTKEELSSRLAGYKPGTREYNYYTATPKEQLDAYNNELEAAATNMAEIARNNSFFPDSSGQIRANKIEANSMSLMELNGPTREMRSELKGQGAPAIDAPPPRDAEDTPASLVVTAAE